MIVKIIDRQMVRGYFKSYLVCLSALLSLYVVVDLFTNLDSFTRGQSGLAGIARHIVSYYGYRVPQIFDKLCEAIVLLAAMFTVAWMQRNNEQVPLLSAGVSTRRIVAPVLLCAFAMLGLAVLNQELLIPRIAEELMLDRDDPEGEKTLPVKGAYEPNKIHITGERAVRRGLVVYKFSCLLPEGLRGGEEQQPYLQAEEAHYRPGRGPRRGGWELIRTQPAEVSPIPDVLEPIDSGRFFLYTREVDFDVLTRSHNWFQMVSTWELLAELNKPDSKGLASVAVLFHTRLTRPLLGMVLVLMGLSVILRDQNRNVFISSGMCLVLCGVFFAACYMSKTAGDYEFLSPAAAAWVPVLVFGPFALVLFDAVHT
jgi:lipopolysaccharide export system permease protein